MLPSFCTSQASPSMGSLNRNSGAIWVSSCQSDALSPEWLWYSSSTEVTSWKWPYQNPEGLVYVSKDWVTGGLWPTVILHSDWLEGRAGSFYFGRNTKSFSPRWSGSLWVTYAQWLPVPELHIGCWQAWLLGLNKEISHDVPWRIEFGCLLGQSPRTVRMARDPYI
jgi:hypothetical protein